MIGWDLVNLCDVRIYLEISLWFNDYVIIFWYILQGAITKRMTAIEEMAGMDVLCSDKTGTLTLNKLTVDKNLIEVIFTDKFLFP